MNKKRALHFGYAVAGDDDVRSRCLNHKDPYVRLNFKVTACRSTVLCGWEWRLISTQRSLYGAVAAYIAESASSQREARISERLSMT